MNVRCIKNNNSEVIIDTNFVYKRFLRGCFDKNTISRFCALDKLLNKEPLIIEVMDQKNVTFDGFKEQDKNKSSILKIKKIPIRSKLTYLIKKGVIDKKDILKIAKKLHHFHLISGGFSTRKIYPISNKWHIDPFLKALKSNHFGKEIKDKKGKLLKIFKKPKTKYKKIMIHGDFIISNIFLYRNNFLCVDFGHLDKHSHDLFIKDVSSFYIDLILNKKEDLAKYFLARYIKLMKEKNIKKLIDIYLLDELMFRYLININYYGKTTRNKKVLEIIENKIIRILNEE